MGKMYVSRIISRVFVVEITENGPEMYRRGGKSARFLKKTYKKVFETYKKVIKKDVFASETYRKMKEKGRMSGKIDRQKAKNLAANNANETKRDVSCNSPWLKCRNYKTDRDTGTAGTSVFTTNHDQRTTITWTENCLEITGINR